MTTKLQKNSIILAGFIITIFTLYFLRTVLTPFLISFCLAYFLNPFASRLEKWHIQRTVGVLLLVILAIVIISTATLLLFPLLKTQIEDVIHNLPNYITHVKSWTAPFIDTFMKNNKDMVESIIEKGMNDFSGIPLKIISSVSTYIMGTLTNFANFVIAGFSLMIIPISTFYILRDMEKIGSNSISYIPTAYRDETVTLLKDINSVIENFLKGQITVSLTLVCLYSIGLYFCGTPLWLLISIIAGFANIVPYLGLIIGMLPAILITFLHYHDGMHTLATLTVFAVVQCMEGIVITPKIIGDKLGLHPLAILFSVFLGGSIFGFFGVLIAVPSAAVVHVCLSKVLVLYKETI